MLIHKYSSGQYHFTPDHSSVTASGEESGRLVSLVCCLTVKLNSGARPWTPRSVLCASSTEEPRHGVT
ncbi:hypothetical protein J6590_027122 [Homalodisca vitripennis]|nr:hypothetical protein J6590_027122 [Homalodisca vitripennis]